MPYDRVRPTPGLGPDRAAMRELDRPHFRPVDRPVADARDERDVLDSRDQADGLISILAGEKDVRAHDLLSGVDDGQVVVRDRIESRPRLGLEERPEILDLLDGPRNHSTTAGRGWPSRWARGGHRRRHWLIQRSRARGEGPPADYRGRG